MDYYHALHDHVISKGYKSVGDGHSGYQLHRFPSLFYQTLLKEFDVKFLMIVRDPVRRAFSEYLYKIQKVSDGRFPKLPDYVSNLHIAYKIFGRDRTDITVMEELWEGTAKKKLSQFLDHPIQKLWKNLYAPDRGHLVEYDKDVPCQAYGQNVELTPQIYDHYRKKYDYIYQSWKREFGSLPLHWGKPIEYKA